DRTSGAILARPDGRNGASGLEILAQHLLAPSGLGAGPARGPLTLSFALPHAAAVRLAIYDATGRRVRDLVSGVEPAGPHEVTGNLNGDDGHRLPAGVSFARLEVEGRTLAEKLVTLQ